MVTTTATMVTMMVTTRPNFFLSLDPLDHVLKLIHANAAKVIVTLMMIVLVIWSALKKGKVKKVIRT